MKSENRTKRTHKEEENEPGRGDDTPVFPANPKLLAAPNLGAAIS